MVAFADPPSVGGALRCPPGCHVRMVRFSAVPCRSQSMFAWARRRRRRLPSPLGFLQPMARVGREGPRCGWLCPERHRRSHPRARPGTVCVSARCSSAKLLAFCGRQAASRCTAAVLCLDAESPQRNGSKASRLKGGGPHAENARIVLRTALRMGDSRRTVEGLPGPHSLLPRPPPRKLLMGRVGHQEFASGTKIYEIVYSCVVYVQSGTCVRMYVHVCLRMYLCKCICMYVCRCAFCAHMRTYV